MAERSSKGNSSNQGTRRENVVTDTSGTASKVEHSAVEKIPECAVCLQTCVHPVQLPCSHIFCFLCVKGAANQSSRCALCRQGIPVEFFNNPTLVGKKDVSAQGFECDGQTETYAWFYEGRNGWWQYDERTNAELEESYNAKKRTFELLIAGFMYVIDLDNMVQMRRNDPSRRRRIKRDLVSAPKKGIAGLKIAARLEATAETVEVPQTAKKEKDETAAGEMPSTASGTLVKAATSSGLGRTTSRSAGVGRDQEHGDPRSVPSDQYDADDDYDGTDDEDTNSAQWRSQQEPAPRFRPQQRGSRLAGNARDPPAGTRQLATSGARAQPQGLPVRHQRVSSAPETRPGRHERHRQALVDGSNPLPQRADSAHVESAMQSLQLSTPNASVYEAVEAPSQPAQGEVRQRRRRQRQNDDIWC